MAKNKILGGLGACAFALATAASAQAGSLVPAGSKLDLSANIGGTTDYIFRGFSQTAENPAIQGGVDATYGLFYAGVWASSLDFGDDGMGNEIASAEVDLYAGITPKIGPVDLDFGVLWYLYPGARDAGAELDYVELKAAASGELLPKLSAGVTYYFSPEFTGEVGTAHAIEGSLGYELPTILRIVTPSITGLVGYQQVEDLDFSAGADVDDDYVYWNAGVELAVGDNLTLDFRYWDTNIDDSLCNGQTFQCDERFVFSANVALP